MAALMTGRRCGFANETAPVTRHPSRDVTPWLAELVVGLAAFYAGAGLCFAIPFAVVGVTRIDPLGAGSPWTFRLVIMPGVVVFWPLLLLRWSAGSIAPPVELNAHRRAAR
jgi:hypothetical protein